MTAEPTTKIRVSSSECRNDRSWAIRVKLSIPTKSTVLDPVSARLVNAVYTLHNIGPAKKSSSSTRAGAIGANRRNRCRGLRRGAASSARTAGASTGATDVMSRS
jgi:hypothetical protein